MTKSLAIAMAALVAATLSIGACSSGTKSTTHEETSTSSNAPGAPTSTTTTTTHTQTKP